MAKISVPFNDLNAQYNGLKSEINSAIADVIEQSSFVRGPYVSKFEEEFSKQLDLNTVFLVLTVQMLSLLL